MGFYEKFKHSSLKEKLVLLGVPVYVVTLVLMLLIDYSLFQMTSMAGDGKHMATGTILLLPAILTLFLDAVNILMGGELYTRTKGLSADTREKQKAMHPALPAKYLSRQPEGFIWGKYRNQYVRTELDPKSKDYQGIMHAMIIGGSGSGKHVTRCHLNVPECHRNVTFMSL